LLSLGNAYIDIYQRLSAKLSSTSTPSSNKATSRIAQTVKQAVCLTGLGLNFFDEAVRNVARIYELFHNNLPEGKLRTWDPEKVDNHLTLNAHARYLTPRRYADKNDVREFEPWVDRNGTLAQLQGASFVHTTDNVVQFFGLKQGSEDDMR
jgi:hypothetical protein